MPEIPTVHIPTVEESPTVEVWPLAGRALGYRSRSATYRAVKSGHIPVVALNDRKLRVPTAALRRMLSLDGGEQ